MLIQKIFDWICNLFVQKEPDGSVGTSEEFILKVEEDQK